MYRIFIVASRDIHASRMHFMRIFLFSKVAFSLFSFLPHQSYNDKYFAAISREQPLFHSHTNPSTPHTRTSAPNGKCRLFCFSYVKLVFTAVDHMRRHIDRRGCIYFISERVFIVSRARGHIHVDLYARVQTAI